MFNTLTRLTFVQNAVRVTGSRSQDGVLAAQLLSGALAGDVCGLCIVENRGRTKEEQRSKALQKWRGWPSGSATLEVPTRNGQRLARQESSFLPSASFSIASLLAFSQVIYTQWTPIIFWLQALIRAYVFHKSNFQFDGLDQRIQTLGGVATLGSGIFFRVGTGKALQGRNWTVFSWILWLLPGIFF